MLKCGSSRVLQSPGSSSHGAAHQGLCREPASTALFQELDRVCADVKKVHLKLMASLTPTNSVLCQSATMQLVS